ncbi:GTP pyrophosphokinase [Enterobacter mori]|uniref:GTP pyrophosphokinase n=1 Tax=Enterobacter mori TaxID=539813 RepID=UPI00397D5D67
MNEVEFLQLWKSEKPMYSAWGDFIVEFICQELEKKYNKNLDSFLKTPAKRRTKSDSSLIDKAFYRSKGYTDPYNDIEDKVGARFVVMLIEDINIIRDIILSAAKLNTWTAIQCRDFVTERNTAPMLFTYQSDHFIIKNTNEIQYKSVVIKSGTPCEIQIRTLLQHAYAELTHDAIYKRKTLIKPEIQRTVAKTMAFIETADEFFTNVTTELNNQPDIGFNAQEILDRIYFDLISITPVNLKSSLLILDEFQDCIDQNFEKKLRTFISRNDYIIEIIKEKRKHNVLYNQSIIFFIYYLVRLRRTQLEASWPLEWDIIPEIALDLGVALTRH